MEGLPLKLVFECNVISSLPAVVVLLVKYTGFTSTWSSKLDSDDGDDDDDKVRVAVALQYSRQAQR